MSRRCTKVNRPLVIVNRSQGYFFHFKWGQSVWNLGTFHVRFTNLDVCFLLDNALNSQNEKADDSKMGDGVSLSGANPPGAGKSAMGAASAVAVNAPSEKVKDNIKEETAALKD